MLSGPDSGSSSGADELSELVADDLDDLDVEILEVSNDAIASLTSDHLLAQGAASCFTYPCWSCCCPPVMEAAEATTPFATSAAGAFDERGLQALGEQLTRQGEALKEAAQAMRTAGGEKPSS